MRTIFLLFMLMSNLVDAKEIRIETIEVYPFGFINSSGQISGMIYAVSNLIAKTAGLNYQNKLVPYPRSILDLKSGKSNFVIRYPNKELFQISIQVGATVGFPSIIIGLKGSKFEKLSDLHGKTVAVIRGGQFDDQFDADHRIIKHEVENYEQMLNMLLIKRVDAVIGSDVGLFHTAKKLKIPKTQLGSPLQLQKKYFILNYSKRSADIKTIESLKAALDKLRTSGEFERIEKEYKADF